MFFEMVKNFSGGHFPGADFKVDPCFLAQEKSLSSLSVKRRLIDLLSMQSDSLPSFC